MSQRCIKMLLPAFCLLLFAFCFSSLPACKKPTEPKTVVPDTTSHDFTWEIIQLGDGNSSVLNDVAIVNDTLAYAVGEIFLKDSTGQFENEPYCLAMWNGRSWKLKKLYYTTTSGDKFVLSNVRGILFVNPSEIWFAAGSIFRWDGSSSSTRLAYSRLNLLDPNATIEKLWGNSNSSLYGVGTVGTIMHYNGSSWQKLESGTDLDIRDIWGAGNEKTGELEVLAVASIPRLAFPRRTIFKLTESTVEIIADSGIVQGTLSGVWFSSGEKYVVVGEGIYRKNHLDEPQWQGAPLELTEFYSIHVRGWAANDIVVVGSFGDLLHFNGSTWKQLPDLQMQVSFTRVAFAKNMVVASGRVGNRAAVVIGKRY